MSYIGLGSRGPVAAVADTTGLNGSNYTTAFTPAVLACNVPFYEIYHMVVANVPVGANAQIVVNNKPYGFTYPLFGAEWNPPQPMLLNPADEVDFLWSVPAGGSSVSGSITSPNAFQILVIDSIPSGTYVINWTVALTGTVGAPEINNFMLMQGPSAGPDTQIAQSINAGAVGIYPQTPVSVTIPSGNQLKIKAWGNTPTVGAVYTGTITPPPPPLVTAYLRFDPVIQPRSLNE